jgi:hypothetical protein
LAFFFILVPLTVIYLALGFFCIVYLSMGIRQVTLGAKEHNKAKLNGGVVSIVFSTICLGVLSYFYFSWIPFW